MNPKLRIATRGSPLALAQTEIVCTQLRGNHAELRNDGAIEILLIKTSGDKNHDQLLSDIGGKGLFSKEIEDALLENRADIAVHSMKDLETELPKGLTIACLLSREDPRDVWITRDRIGIEEIAEGAILGTASMRRAAQILARRPDIRISPLRGNVHTRLQKLAAGEADATLLALAGLRRLGIEMKVGGTILNPSILLPAVGQGAVGVQCRIGDQSVIDLLSPLNDPDTESSVTAERALLAALDGSCRTPIGGLAQHQLDCNLHLQAMVATPDGTLIYRTERTGPPVDAARMGDDAGRELRAVAGGDIFP